MTATGGWRNKSIRAGVQDHRSRQAHSRHLRSQWVGDSERTAEQLREERDRRLAETRERRPEWFA